MKFYDFGSELLSSTVQAKAFDITRNDFIEIPEPQWRLILGNYEGISLPVKFKQQSGKKLRDILDTGWPSLYLISDHLKNILLTSGLTGWKTFEVQVFDSKSHPINGYHGFSITGRAGILNFSESTIIEKKLVPNGPLSKYYKGFYFDLDEWDKSDFFLPSKYYGIYISEKAFKILSKEKITNLSLGAIDEIEMMDYTVEAYLQKNK